MNLEQQKEILSLYNQYQDTNRDTIKANIKQYMDQSNIKPSKLSEQTNIPIQTIYQLRKLNNPYKPDFITTLIICNALEISITAILLPLVDNNSSQLITTRKKSKWTSKTKQEFLNDYNSLPITELCKKYSITERTAGEYHRQFTIDVCGQV
jgi:predicted transcriptional regulator